MDLKNLKTVFGGCVKDCSKFLPTSIKNLRDYSSLFGKVYTVIVENGSSDNTKEILREKKTENDTFLFCDQFNKFIYRNQRLERARNLIIETIQKSENMKNCDLFIMLDLDDMGTYRIKNEDILYSVKYLYSSEEIAAVFGNQLGGYYDMWPLRDKTYCKNDFWVEVFKYLMMNKNSFEQISKKILLDAKKNIIDKKSLSFKKTEEPVPVFSAFGGLGIYKMKNVLQNKNKYQGTQNFDVVTKDKKKFNVNYQKCEHVNFNEGIVNQNKKLYILPQLINQKFIKVEFNPESALKLIIK